MPRRNQKRQLSIVRSTPGVKVSSAPGGDNSSPGEKKTPEELFQGADVDPSDAASLFDALDAKTPEEEDVEIPEPAPVDRSIYKAPAKGREKVIFRTEDFDVPVHVQQVQISDPYMILIDEKDIAFVPRQGKDFLARYENTVYGVRSVGIQFYLHVQAVNVLVLVAQPSEDPSIWDS